MGVGGCGSTRGDSVGWGGLWVGGGRRDGGPRLSICGTRSCEMGVGGCGVGVHERGFCGDGGAEGWCQHPVMGVDGMGVHWGGGLWDGGGSTGRGSTTERLWDRGL